MARHSKHERERRKAETERVREIEAAWMGSLPTAQAKAFAESVASGARPRARRRSARTWRPAPRRARRVQDESPVRRRTSAPAGIRATATSRD